MKKNYKDKKCKITSVLSIYFFLKRLISPNKHGKFHFSLDNQFPSKQRKFRGSLHELSHGYVANHDYKTKWLNPNLNSTYPTTCDRATTFKLLGLATVSLTHARSTAKVTQATDELKIIATPLKIKSYRK